MDLYEQLVETYLTVIEECAIIPQVPIRENRKGEKWEAYPDFLALNFATPSVQIIEVNKSTDPRRVKQLIRRRHEERADIEHYIENRTLDRQLKWAIGWRFFIRRDHLKAADATLRKLNFQADVKDLETVFETLARRMP